MLVSRLYDDLAVFALTLFSVEAFALFPILRRRIQVRPLLTAFEFSCPYAVNASSGSIGRYAIARVGRINGTITQTLCSRFDECDIWGTWCLDVGTAVQIVSLSICYFFFFLGITQDVPFVRSAVHGMPRRRVDLNGGRVTNTLCFESSGSSVGIFLCAMSYFRRGVPNPQYTGCHVMT